MLPATAVPRRGLEKLSEVRLPRGGRLEMMPPLSHHWQWHQTRAPSRESTSTGHWQDPRASGGDPYRHHGSTPGQCSAGGRAAVTSCLPARNTACLYVRAAQDPTGVVGGGTTAAACRRTWLRVSSQKRAAAQRDAFANAGHTSVPRQGGTSRRASGNVNPCAADRCGSPPRPRRSREARSNVQQHVAAPTASQDVGAAAPELMLLFRRQGDQCLPCTRPPHALVPTRAGDRPARRSGRRRRPEVHSGSAERAARLRAPSGREARRGSPGAVWPTGSPAPPLGPGTLSPAQLRSHAAHSHGYSQGTRRGTRRVLTVLAAATRPSRGSAGN